MTLQKIALFSHSDYVGDALLVLHAAQRLRQTLPNAELVWISAGLSPLRARVAWLAQPYINRMLDNTGIAMVANPKIITEKFDAVLDLQIRRGGAQGLAVKRALVSPLYISDAAGFRHSSRRPWFGRARTWWLLRPSRLVQRFVYLADLLTGERGLGALPLMRHDIRAWRALAAQTLPDGARYIGFGPGGGAVSKDWPLPKYIALAKIYAARGFVPVFFLGPAEQDQRQIIAAQIPTARFPEQEVALLRPPFESVPFAMALAERLDAAVATDSGIGHILAGAHIPLVLLFRRARLERFLPHTQNLVCVRASRLGRFGVAGRMKRIVIARVVRALDVQLRRANHATHIK